MNYSEAAVIGGLLIDNQAWWRITGRVSEQDFEADAHRKLFALIAGEIEQGRTADIITLGVDKPLRSLAMQLASDSAGTANIVSYADAVRTAAQGRMALRAMLEGVAALKSEQPVREVIQSVSQALEAVGRSSIGTSMSFQEIIRAGLSAIERANERRTAGNQAGVPTGIPAVDRRTGGLHPGQLIVVAARPGVGKTALTSQIALHAASHGEPVGICSLEMSDEQLAIRAFAHKLKVNGTALKVGEDAAMQEVLKKLPESHMRDLPIWTDTSTYSLDGIVARLTEWRRKHEIHLAVVDHIGLIESEGYGNRNDQLGNISRRLKKLAKQLDIPILAVSQLNRSVEKEGRRPRLSDLRDSGNIEQDVDVGLFLHTEADTDASEAVTVEIGLLKNRDGRKGWITTPTFQFHGPTQTFREIATPYAVQMGSR